MENNLEIANKLDIERDLKLVKKLATLHMLTDRWIGRNKGYGSITVGQFNSIVMGKDALEGRTKKVTYLSAVTELKKFIFKYAKESDYLCKEIEKLEEAINNSPIKSLKVAEGCTTREENVLGLYRIKVLFIMQSLVSLKIAEETLGISTSTLKRYCQEEKLLNTKKVGKTWLVNIEECIDVFNISIGSKLDDIYEEALSLGRNK